MRSLVVFMLLVASISNSQASGGNRFFGEASVKIHGGYVLPHDKQMHHLSVDNFLLYQVSLSGQTRGNKAWHHLYNHPYLGFDLLFGGLGYDEVLGRALAFFPHIRTGLLHTSSLSLELKHGLGLAYLTRSYHPVNNEENIAIGSAMNIAVHSSLNLNWQFTPEWRLLAGLSLTHFSNGKIETPNKGLNIPSAHLGIAHHFSKPELLPQSPASEKPQIEWLAIAAGGFTASYPPGSGRSARYSFTTTWNYAVSKKHKLGLGYDFFFSYPEKGEGNGNPFINHGLHFSFQQDYSRMAVVLHNGVYLWDPAGERQYFYYHRAGLRYRAGERLIVNLSLKTHLFQAEFIEWGVGYILW